MSDSTVSDSTVSDSIWMFPPQIFAEVEDLVSLIAEIPTFVGAPTLIVGPGSAGKTMAAQQLALAVATGQPVWGRFPARRCRVAHVDAEQGLLVTRARYRRLASGFGITMDEIPANGLALARGPRECLPPLDSAGAEDAWAEALDGFGLLIVDCLFPMCSTTDENSAAMRRVLDVLAKVSEAVGVCVIVLHHTGKQREGRVSGRDAARGSSAIFDAAGAVLIMTPNDDRSVSVNVAKARVTGCDRRTAVLRIVDGEDDALRVECSAFEEDSGGRGRPETLDRRVLNALRENETVTRNEIQRRLGVARAKVLDVIRDMINAGTLVSTDEGVRRA